MDYFEGYQLNDDTYSWMLSPHDNFMMSAVVWLVDNKDSLRKVSREYLVSRSQLHRYIHEQLPHISYELYKCAIRQLNMNKKKYFKAS